MNYFVIVEVEDGLIVVEVEPDETPDDAAIRNGGVLVDPGPYRSFNEATDAAAELQIVDEG